MYRIFFNEKVFMSKCDVKKVFLLNIQKLNKNVFRNQN